MEIRESKVVTIVAEAALEPRIASLLERMGVSGIAATPARAAMFHGVGHVAARDSVRIEALCPAATAENVLREIAARYLPDFACMAWATPCASIAVDRAVAPPLSIVG